MREYGCPSLEADESLQREVYWNARNLLAWRWVYCTSTPPSRILKSKMEDDFRKSGISPEISVTSSNTDSSASFSSHAQ